MVKLVPEWYPQEAVILAWPDEKTDWQPWLEQVQNTYLELIHAICAANCAVILLVRPEKNQALQTKLDASLNLLLVEADYNDTWVRDYGFLSCQSESGMQPVEFIFNGWGNKFDASKDNLVNQSYLSHLCKLPLISVGMVCEGGAIEIDEQQHLLSTQLCLSNPERNGDLELAIYAETFSKHLGATQTSILTQGHLEGDDTDGHIDTLVRFTPNKALVVQSCFNRPEDTHYNSLNALVAECKASFPQHDIYQLPLPYIINQKGERLPASYANYLINNQQVLVPIYQQPEDNQALNLIAKAYPSFEIVAIDALPLVQQFGSIHCISMQVPKGILKSEVIKTLSRGLSRWNAKQGLI